MVQCGWCEGMSTVKTLHSSFKNYPLNPASVSYFHHNAV